MGEKGTNSLDGRQQFVADLRRLRGWLNLRAHGGKCCGLQHGDPTIGKGVCGEICGRRGGQLAGELSGETHSCLRRLRRQLERPDDPPDTYGGVDVFEPQRQFAFLLGDQRGFQIARHGSCRFVTSNHRIFACGHDAAQVAKIKILDIGSCRICTVEPFGDAQPWQQTFGHRQQSSGRYFRFTLRLEPGILLIDGLANRWQSTLQSAFGNRTLFFGKVGKHGVAMDPTRLQSLCLWPLRQLGRRGEIRTCAPLGARATLGTSATARTTTGWTLAGWAITSCSIGAHGCTVTPRWPVAGIAAWPTIACGAVASWTPIAAIATVVSVFPGELLGDTLEGLVAWDQIQQARFFSLVLVRRY